MWVAFSGAHRTGKTTLINRLPGCKVGNVMRDLHARGVPVGHEATPATMIAYARAQAVAEQAHLTCPLVISDRTLVDGFAYVSAAVHLGIASYPWSAAELDVLRAGAVLQASRYALHIMIPAEFEFTPEGSFHGGGAQYRVAIEEELTRALSDWPCTVVTVQGQLDARVAKVQKLLEDVSADHPHH